MKPWLFIRAPRLAFLERRAFGVASKGRQLGLITEVLTDPAAQTPPDSAKVRHPGRLAAARGRITRTLAAGEA